MRNRNKDGRFCKEHGFYGTPTYTSWYQMKSRCKYPSNRSYKWYGARGIKYCERWEKFENFLEDMGTRPDGCSLDRIDANGDYCPENCRWVDKLTQQNNKRNNHWLTIGGQTHTVAEWGRISGISNSLIWDRMRRNSKRPILSKRREPIMIKYNGQEKTINEWSEELGIKTTTIHERLRRGWSVEDVLTRKVQK